MSGRYDEEFEVGETMEHARRRTVSEAEDHRFRGMTMNGQPLHLDAALARDTQFGNGSSRGCTPRRWRSGRRFPTGPTEPSS